MDDPHADRRVCTRARRTRRSRSRWRPRPGVPAGRARRASSAIGRVTVADAPRRGATRPRDRPSTAPAWRARCGARSGGAGWRARSRGDRRPRDARPARDGARSRGPTYGGEVGGTTSTTRSRTTARPCARRRGTTRPGIGEQDAGARECRADRRPREALRPGEPAAGGLRVGGPVVARAMDRPSPAGMSAASDRGRRRHPLGSSGASTSTSHRARAGGLHSFSTRCTPPPPAGGK